eukprot:3055349-Prymnesium_polylepis.1
MQRAERSARRGTPMQRAERSARRGTPMLGSGAFGAARHSDAGERSVRRGRRAERTRRFGPCAGLPRGRAAASERRHLRAPRGEGAALDQRGEHAHPLLQ